MLYTKLSNGIKFLQNKTNHNVAQPQLTDKNKNVFSQREYLDSKERVLNIYTHYVGGLSNRIKQIFSRMHLYEGMYDTVDLHWKLGGSVYNRFFELFDFSKFQRINEINHSVFLDKNCREDDTWCLLLNQSEREQIKDKIPNGYIDLQYQNIPESARNVYLPYFNALKPSEKIQNIINQVEIPHNCVSVHIRHNSVWRMWKRWADDDLNQFINKMKEYDENTSFILACADQEIYNQMCKIFEGRIVSLPDKQVTDKDNFQDIAELYLLSKGRELIATYGSTYSEVAWWLSGCNQKVTVIGNQQNWEELKKS